MKVVTQLISISYQRKEKTLMPIVFIGPSVLFLVCFIVYPILYSVQISFKDFFLAARTAPTWAGLQNYQTILRDEVFWNSVRVTGIYSASTVIISFLLAFVLALLLSEIHGRRFFLSLILLPITVPPVVVGLMFKLIFVKQYGIADYLMSLTGLPAPNWLADAKIALTTLIGVSIWLYLSLSVVILIAGLQGVPDELYESADLDGRTNFSAFSILPFRLSSQSSEPY